MIQSTSTTRIVCKGVFSIHSTYWCQSHLLRQDTASPRRVNSVQLRASRPVLRDSAALLVAPLLLLTDEAFELDAKTFESLHVRREGEGQRCTHQCQPRRRQ